MIIKILIRYETLKLIEQYKLDDKSLDKLLYDFYKNRMYRRKYKADDGELICYDDIYSYWLYYSNNKLVEFTKKRSKNLEKEYKKTYKTWNIQTGDPIKQDPSPIL